MSSYPLVYDLPIPSAETTLMISVKCLNKTHQSLIPESSTSFWWVSQIHKICHHSTPLSSSYCSLNHIFCMTHASWMTRADPAWHPPHHLHLDKLNTTHGNSYSLLNNTANIILQGECATSSLSSPNHFPISTKTMNPFTCRGGVIPVPYTLKVLLDQDSVGIARNFVCCLCFSAYPVAFIHGNTQMQEQPNTWDVNGTISASPLKRTPSNPEGCTRDMKPWDMSASCFPTGISPQPLPTLGHATWER